MRIAITGVAGFIGSNLAARLVARGDEIRGVDDLSHGFLRNLDSIARSPLFQLTRGSILDRSALDAALSGAEVVVHLAAGKIPRYSDALDTLTTNGEGGLHVLRAAVAHGVRRMVFASTSDCYGRNTDVPFAETTPSVIGSPLVRRWSYAVSKMFEEHLLMAFRERHGIEGVILRLFGAYGPRQNLTWWGGPQSVFIAAALRNEELELHGTGQQTRSFTFVEDTVECFVRAIDRADADGQLLNAGNAEEVPIAQLADRIWRLIRDDEPRVRLVPLATFGRYEDVQRRVPDTRLSSAVLGFTPQTKLSEGLPPTIDWQRRVMRAEGLL
jgi:UDP-glucose 4-epimerase